MKAFSRRCYCSEPVHRNGLCVKHNRERNKAWNDHKAEAYHNREWRRIRKVILARDYHQCVICGDAATQVHHLDHDTDNRLPTNLVSFCSRCHMQIEKEYRNKINNGYFHMRLYEHLKLVEAGETE